MIEKKKHRGNRLFKKTFLSFPNQYLVSFSKNEYHIKFRSLGFSPFIKIIMSISVYILSSYPLAYIFQHLLVLKKK